MPQLSTCSCITVQVDIQYYLAILQYCCNYNTAYYLTVLYTVHNTKQLEIVETVFFFPLCVEILQHYTGRTAAPKNVCRKFGDSNTGRRPHQSNRFF